ncbi:hypothetical protein DdX_20563 [Ditylenchus destructor]|uniref:Uncharacterized protein n=1 Tax=Ditylenchus destructor TaxID=166010 RepID=A0AAD4MHU8_9BILA|nr:hypothetical protein DdX_20558 [Ditylenchus destructor]KAI1693614.1 hypothetical protein DdX_20561 [Ditylenchus destructor]KAI1693616.1 hypothetical protein DdX_20563 [Ditylenchus destructor]
MAKYSLRSAMCNVSKVSIMKGPSTRKQRKNQNSQMKFISKPLMFDLLSSALSFLKRSQLLRLSTISDRLQHVQKKDFATTPYLVLDKLSVDRFWRVNSVPLVTSFQKHFLRQLPLCKFVRFNNTIISNRNVRLERIEHVFKGRELHVNTCDIPNPKRDLIKTISNSQDLVLDGNKVFQWLPEILNSCTLNSLSIWDSTCVLNSTPRIPIDEIVEFLFKPASNDIGKKLEIRSEIEHSDSEALVDAVTEKFKDSTSHVAFRLTWYDENWTPVNKKFKKSTIKTMLCLHAKKFKYSLHTCLYS